MLNKVVTNVIDINEQSLKQTLKLLTEVSSFTFPYSSAVTNDSFTGSIQILGTAVEQPQKLVVFGELSWSNVTALLSTLPAKSVESAKAKQPHAALLPALELQLTQPLSKEQQKALNAQAEKLNLECCYVENAPSLNKPGLIVMDMDSTAIEIECIDEIAKLAGVGEQVSEVTAAAMRGELDFAESLRARVATLTNAPVSVIDQVADNLPIMAGFANLVDVLQQNNWKVVIASGGFTYMTNVLKRQFNLDKTVANQLEMKDGLLTGQVLGDIVDAQTKADTVIELAKEYNLPLSQTIAMGDGANDLVMMAAANLGVAFHAKPLVREQADVSVKKGGLDQLLYLI